MSTDLLDRLLLGVEEIAELAKITNPEDRATAAWMLQQAAQELVKVATEQRDAAVLDLHREGRTTRAIGATLGISGQRADQIIQRAKRAAWGTSDAVSCGPADPHTAYLAYLDAEYRKACDACTGAILTREGYAKGYTDHDIYGPLTAHSGRRPLSYLSEDMVEYLTRGGGTLPISFTEFSEREMER